MKGTHLGWTAEENDGLMAAVSRARLTHKPLRTAFESVAAHTGRRPNSVRNHYYTQLRAAAPAQPTFVPFSEAETERLLRCVLLAQAAGRSVRACTLDMANGDTQRMLRYQNKYRALLKSQPERVRETVAALMAEGHPVPDPYTRDPLSPHVGRPPKASKDWEHSIRSLLDALYASILELTREGTA